MTARLLKALNAGSGEGGVPYLLQNCCSAGEDKRPELRTVSSAQYRQNVYSHTDKNHTNLQVQLCLQLMPRPAWLALEGWQEGLEGHPRWTPLLVMPHCSPSTMYLCSGLLATSDPMPAKG